jgi:hypothetical protein
MFVKVKDLPDSLQNALKSVGYGRSDISVQTAERVSVFNAGGAGYRDFAILVDIASGEKVVKYGNWGGSTLWNPNNSVKYGSWGGSTLWNPNNSVDLDDKEYDLPVGGAVVRGSEGRSRPVSASIYLNPKNAAPWLPQLTDLTEAEKFLLAQFRSLKPGHRSTVGKEAMIDSLVKGGFLARAKNGATRITTKGKNACLDVAATSCS